MLTHDALTVHFNEKQLVIANDDEFAEMIEKEWGVSESEDHQNEKE